MTTYRRIFAEVEALFVSKSTNEEILEFTNNVFNQHKDNSEEPIKGTLWDSYHDEEMLVFGDDVIIKDPDNGGFFMLDEKYFVKFFEEV